MRRQFPSNWTSLNDVIFDMTASSKFIKVRDQTHVSGSEELPKTLITNNIIFYSYNKT